MPPIRAMPMPATTPIPCAGFCDQCNQPHGLGAGDSVRHALALQAELEKKGRIDLTAVSDNADPDLDLAYLFGPARGQMFGVLTYQAPDGSQGVLRAFSGQYNGRWQVAGWVPPLFDVRQWYAINDPQEARIKELSRRIDQLADTPDCRDLRQERRRLSQQLMQRLHGLYRLHNFRGQVTSLPQAFRGPGGIPTGTGDCCAPKLLDYAARHGLRPLGISEFYMGRTNRSGTREHGAFYPSCAGKCQPILGHLLCGLDQERHV